MLNENEYFVYLMHAAIVLTHAVSHSYALLHSNIYYSETHLLVCTKIICIFILIKSKSIEFNIILV